jgi:hypothetical protein
MEVIIDSYLVRSVAIRSVKVTDGGLLIAVGKVRAKAAAVVLRCIPAAMPE